jgi:AraC-like DNA-binding protein
MVKDDQHPDEVTGLFQTEDSESAKQRISSLFSSHELVPATPRAPLNVRLSATRLKNITIARLGYGPEVLIRPGRLGYFKLDLPLRGTTVSSSGEETVHGDTNMGVIFGPEQRAEMRWGEGCEQLCIKINREAVEQHLSHALGHPIDAPLHFEPNMGLSKKPVQTWHRTLQLLLADVKEDPNILQQPLIVSHLEDLLIIKLLHAQRHNYSAALHDGTPEARPRTVKRVIDLIQESPQEQYSASDLARAAGVSLRTLQDSFKVHLGTTPMAYLRNLRLAKAHEDLLESSAEDGATVTDIAYKWGFSHVPRFAVTYRSRYGVSPSTNLRRA